MPVRRVLAYAHFDAEGAIRSHVLHALRAMRPLCPDIRFVTTSRLSAEERAKVLPLVRDLIEVENVGFDFAMWKRAIAGIDLGQVDELVLMNSSVHGPFRDMGKLFGEMQGEPCDAWGITESLEHDRHLQSYFLVFRRAVLASEAFRAFWASVLPYAEKRQVIRSYEIGLSQWLAANGFRLQASCPWAQVVRQVAARAKSAYPIPHGLQGVPRLAAVVQRTVMRALHRVYVYPVNPAVAFPAELLDQGVPFLKLEVMRENPFDVDREAIEGRVRALGYPTSYLDEDPPRVLATDIPSDPAPACPVCGGAGAVLHAGMGDCLRMGGPKPWNVRRCASPGCGCAWLDPVPLESEIHRAYETYFTHPEAVSRVSYVEPEYGPVTRAVRRLVGLALALVGLGPRRARYWLHGIDGSGGRLLEVGCGAGARLEAFRAKGWSAEGQEVDASAARNCRSKGLVVHEGPLETLGLPAGSFDVVLLSHVIEHLHRPVEVLSECRRLLRPGGKLFVSTPNVESLGHRTWGRSWLPLDPPRHLVIHSRRSLERVIRDAGFGSVDVRTVALNAEITALHSRDIKYHGWTDWNTVPRLHKELVPYAFQLAALLLHPVLPGSGEECFAVATKE